MSTAGTTPAAAPTDMPDWAIPVEDLEAMLATDDDSVDTAAIPRLAFREAVEESAATSTSSVTTLAVAHRAPETTTDELTSEAPATTPLGHSLRGRHATPESVAAIRRNLVALATVVVALVVIGGATAWFAGWVALAAYAVVVLAAAVAMHRVNARYAPRHSRYTARHA